MDDLSDFAAAGTIIEEKWVRVDPQVKLRVICFQPPQDTTQPVVVFVAGWVSQIDAWKNVLLEMTRDFPVIYLETREKISSVITGGVDFGVETIGKDIVTLVKSLDLAQNSYLLFGSSLGATAIVDGMRFSEELPRCLVLVGPNAEFRVPALGKFIITLFPPVLYLLIKPVVKWYLRHFRLDIQHDYAQYEKYSRALDAADPWKLKPALLALSRYEIWNTLKSVTCPTLIIGAEKDKLHEPQNLRKIVETLRDCTYIDMQTNKGTHSREVVIELRDFLQKLHPER